MLSRQRSEDTKSLQAALEKYKRAVESSVQGGVMELGLKGFSQALVEIASRDSIKARTKACAAMLCAAADRARARRCRRATWPVRVPRQRASASEP